MGRNKRRFRTTTNERFVCLPQDSEHVRSTRFGTQVNCANNTVLRGRANAPHYINNM